MSDTIDMFRAVKDMRAAERAVFGIECPVCIARLPKAHPKVLQPGQVCRAHKPHYRDERERPTVEQYNAAMAETGWIRQS